MQTILIVGAADTGRAPMAAALLRRMLVERGRDWHIGSAGVLGHDDDPPEPEARTAMVHLGLSIDNHRARSVSTALIEAAALVVAIDSGTVKAINARFPAVAQIYSLGALASTGRDIPDPFRMQVGAWMTYARELETLLAAAFEPMAALVEGQGSVVGVQGSGAREETGSQEQELDTSPALPRRESAPVNTPTLQRREEDRIALLLDVLVAMPEVLDWAAAKQRLDMELAHLLHPLAPSDMAPAYGGLLRAALALTAAPPTPQQALALQAAFARLAQPITAVDLGWLAAQIGGWAALG